MKNELMNAALFYPAKRQQKSGKAKFSNFGPARANILGGSAIRSPARNKNYLEQVNVNGKLKYIKRFDDKYDQYYGTRLANTDQRLKQRGMAFDQIFNTASKPIDEMVQNSYPAPFGGSLKQSRRIVVKGRSSGKKQQNYMQMARSNS